MPLYIRDSEVDELAERVKRLTGATTKTEAVKAALRHEIERASSKPPLSERLRRAWEIADSIGPANPEFEQKTFFDEMWDDS